MPKNEKNLRDEVGRLIEDSIKEFKEIDEAAGYYLSDNLLYWQIARRVIRVVAKHLHIDIFDGYVVHKGKE